MALPRTERPRGLAAAAASDPGRQRGNNEDRVLASPELGIFAVIDGVGGESAGEVAADIALEVLQARLSRRTTDLGRLVREAIALANRQIYERAKHDPHLSGMACVLTVAVLDGPLATIGHVGDSRLYALSVGEIKKVTLDHSPVGLREDAGELSEEEAMRHPRRNEIFRDVGSAPHEPDERDWIDVLEVPFPDDGALLLCSDGLSDMISSREILETIEESAVSPGGPSGAGGAGDLASVADLAVHALIDRANRAGGRDNVSAVLVLGDRYVETVRRRGSAGSRGGKSGRSGRKAAATAATAAGKASDRVAARMPGRLAEKTLDKPLSSSALRGAARARPGAGERL
jgi:serine/threonine protein phosphatase PrpC